jgi:hypothetical protein
MPIPGTAQSPPVLLVMTMWLPKTGAPTRIISRPSSKIAPAAATAAALNSEWTPSLNG